MRVDRELVLEFARVAEAAAIEAARWVGRGDKERADGAAVDAMRALFDTVAISGRVVIGEGEMDEAPMLYIGEEVGRGGPAIDIAVDPVEGTTLTAKGLNGAVAVLAVAPRGHLLHAPDMYMQKIAVGPAGKGRVRLDRSVAENLAALADASNRAIEDLTVVILDRERHQDLIRDVRAAGARVQLISDGDVAPAVATCLPGTGVDMVLGSGGAPEGVLAAAAVKSMGGDFQGRLLPQDAEEAARAHSMGIEDVNRILTLDDLVKGDDVLFAATGITDGDLLQGVRFLPGNVATTQTLVIRGKTGTVRTIQATHHLDRKEYPRLGR